MARKRVAILISGRGSNFEAIADNVAAGAIPAEIAAVISNRPEALGLEAARRRGLNAICIPSRGLDREVYDRMVLAELCKHGVDLVCLAGFMRLLSATFIRSFPNRILNIHPSLLPKYKGLDTHARAIEAGDSVAGCSVHVVTEELDGGEVLGQAEVPLLPDDTPATLADRVLAAEHRLYPRVLADFVTR
jgi:formyltetrahydrofolate-dependent phosphoribosylglycinamide formyltransferase